LEVYTPEEILWYDRQQRNTVSQIGTVKRNT